MQPLSSNLVFNSEHYGMYRKVASKSTCYCSGNQVFGGATNRARHVTKRDMFLFINSKILDFKVVISNMP